MRVALSNGDGMADAIATGSTARILGAGDTGRMNGLPSRRALMRKLGNRFWADESGQDLAEYALLLALIAIGVMAALPGVRDALKSVFDGITAALKVS